MQSYWRVEVRPEALHAFVFRNRTLEEFCPISAEKMLNSGGKAEEQPLAKNKKRKFPLD